jgi:hypothetical protein
MDGFLTLDGNTQMLVGVAVTFIFTAPELYKVVLGCVKEEE